METRDGLVEILRFYQEIGADFLGIEHDDPAFILNAIHHAIKHCKKCSLHQIKKNYVPGEGSLTPDIFFIGEGPGDTEDKFGRPFIGKAGQLLDKLIKKMGYTRDAVFIGNIVKCRPPNNRNPLKEEVTSCLPYLINQIDTLKPKILVCLGKVALDNLIGESFSISKVRGQRFTFKNVPVISTYHPSYILHLRTKEEISRAKWEVWEDMQKVLQIIKGLSG